MPIGMAQVLIDGLDVANVSAEWSVARAWATKRVVLYGKPAAQ